jgi:hypothetical protein
MPNFRSKECAAALSAIFFNMTVNGPGYPSGGSPESFP